MSKMIDLTGRRFGKLTVLEQSGRSNQGRVKWRCRCDCGAEAIVSGTDLRSGQTKSCGCLRKTSVREAHVRHGGSHTRLFRIWCGMHTRCYNTNDHGYMDYGGRGIAICDEWLSDFTAFRDWALSNGYAETLSIDRIDNDKGYSPDNCRWTCGSTQRANQRPHKRSVTPVLCVETGRKYTSMTEATRETGISVQCISNCINKKQKRAGGYTWIAITET